ncbi:hypothetical protein KC460_03365 [Candidatus Dependentiae bacterium]|nr:hypothetical protein [Candidatus Dependentiae bacterium]
MKEKKKRLIIDIDNTTHTTIKAHVANMHTTMRRWILKVLIEALKRESLGKY